MSGMAKQDLKITAVWLRRIGDEAQVLLEIDGQWRLVIQEYWDGSYSHIAEAVSPNRWPPDPVTNGQLISEATDHRLNNCRNGAHNACRGCDCQCHENDPS